MLEPMEVIYRAVGVIEGCMISSVIQVAPGISLHPLDGGVLREAERLLVNDVFHQAKVGSTFGSEAWHRNQATNRPVIVVVLHAYPARTADEAAVGARGIIGRIADILTLHRGAAARMIATAVCTADGSGEPRLFDEHPMYRGNLLSGIISGEDAPALNNDLIASAKDPVLTLWLAMTRDATAETNPEFAVARWWNLVEAMATARQPPGKPVVDFTGQPFRDRKGTQLTTSDTRARVHEFVRRHFDRREVSEQVAIVSDSNQLGTGSLWQTICGWIGLRNAVAHYGTFSMTSSEQQTKGWYADAKAARELDLRRGFHYQRYRIRELAQTLLRWELADALGEASGDL